MPFRQELPWLQIHDYLAEVGAAENVGQFTNLALTRIAQLVSFDVNGVFIVLDAAGTPRIQNTVAELGKWAGLFHEYYWKQLPEIGLETMQTGIIHWNNYRSTEYVADFLKPLGIWHSMGALCLGGSNRLWGWLVLHSSKSGPKFSERDKFILEIIQPHLSNLYSVYLKLAASNQSFSDADSLKAEYRSLSKREAEVAALLCKGLRSDIVGSMLMISPRTVSTHIENIYEKLKVSSKQELLVKLLGNE